MAVVPVTEITNVSKQLVLIPYEPTNPDLSATSVPAASAGILQLQPGVQFSIETSRLQDLGPIIREGLIVITARKVTVPNIQDIVGDGLSQGLAVVAATADVPSIPQSPPSTTSIAADDNFQTNLNTQLTGENVQINDTDDGTSGLESFLVTQPNDGQAVIFRNGDLEYEPNPGFDGFDTLTYQNRDSIGWTNIATVTIQVLPF